MRAYVRYTTSLVVVVTLLLNPGISWGWGSMDRLVFGGVFGTHQFLCREAYKLIENHPALPYVGFPSIDEIIAYSSVSILQTGNGPDNPTKSTYWQHWYNPLKKTGENPASVEKYYKALRKNLQEYTLLGKDTDVQADGEADARVTSNNEARENLPLQAAENAAYAAHYIQDMTCPFHLVGMPKSEDRRSPAKKDITGPYRDFVKNPQLWQSAVTASNADNAAGSNWFDPNYYDGSGDMPNKSSSHVLYEILVETSYQRDSNNNQMALALQDDQVSKFWNKGASIKEFTHNIAYDVRQRLDAEDPEIFFDINPIHERISKAQALGRDPASQRIESLEDSFEYIDKTVGEIIAAGFFSKIPVPYREWAQAIQATYFLWRSSFCALMIKKEDIKIEKVPNERGVFKVMVRVTNLEPTEEVTSVEVTYKYKDAGTTCDGGSARVGEIKAGECSEWLELSPALRAEDFGKLTMFRFAVKGIYAKTPDAGMTVVQYERTQIASDAIKLHDVMEEEYNSAVTQLRTQSREFEIGREYGRSAPTYNKEHTVINQVPSAGTWVAPKEKITLTILNTYSTVTFKGVVRDLMSKKKIAGVTIQVSVGGFSGSTVSRSDGKFEFSMELNPETMEKRPPVKVTVTHQGYAIYQTMLTLFGDEWRLDLRPDIKPEFEVRIENIKIEPAGQLWNRWTYEAVVKVKKVGVQFTKMDVRENTSAGEELNRDTNLYLKAGEEKRSKLMTAAVGYREIGDINNIVQEVTLRGMDDNGAPAQLSFTFRSDKKMVDKILQNQNMQADALIKQYLEAYEYQAGGFKLDAYEIVVPIEEAYKGQDHLIFVKALCDSKKTKFFVNKMRQYNYDELDKIMILVQFYINKTAMTGDRRYEEKAAYIMRFLVPTEFYKGHVRAWNANTGERAKQLVPEFFSDPVSISDW